jgi:ATP-dependent Lon protease
MNPVLYFDELDKISSSSRGDELNNVLIHLTDPIQNYEFNDKYFNEIDFDLSKCLMIFTYNNENCINPILKDRMITINTKDYSIQDKITLSKQYLIPAVLKYFKLDDTKLNISDDIITYIISKIDEESGVRNLKRAFENIISNLNLNHLLKNDEIHDEVTIVMVDKFIKSNRQEQNP